MLTCDQFEILFLTKDAAILELTDRLDLNGDCERKLSQAHAQMAKYKEKIEEVLTISDFFFQGI
jgi:hypothetical protein